MTDRTTFSGRAVCTAVTLLLAAPAFAQTLCVWICVGGGLDPGDACDDGSTTPGGGCDASCQVEP